MAGLTWGWSPGRREGRAGPAGSRPFARPPPF